MPQVFHQLTLIGLEQAILNALDVHDPTGVYYCPEHVIQMGASSMLFIVSGLYMC